MNDIPFQISSTVDSMFNDFGTFEIYVQEDNKDRAIDVLNNYEDASDA
tara:strand:+ start:154 stop:297 length:144 start_codon:yes stop_codon:yes gene_type:complete